MGGTTAGTLAACGATVAHVERMSPALAHSTSLLLLPCSALQPGRGGAAAMQSDRAGEQGGLLQLLVQPCWYFSYLRTHSSQR